MARKRHKKRKSQRASSSKFPVSGKLPSTSVPDILTQASILLEQGQIEQALALLEPLSKRASHFEDVWILLGVAYQMQERPWEAAVAFRRALKRAPRRPDIQATLMQVYLYLEFRALPWNLLQKLPQDLPLFPEEFRRDELEAILDEELSTLSQTLGLPRKQVEQGIYYMEEGEIMLHTEAYDKAINLNRRAIRLLPQFPPPANNLALALFFSGRWEEAIKVEQEVLAYDPENIQALSNLIRFYRWTEQDAQAEAIWARLKTLTPEDSNLLLKQTTAAAIMDDDQAVYDLLQTLRRHEGKSFLQQWPWGYYLAIAEANLGHTKAALRRLLALQNQNPKAIAPLLEALREKRKSLGLTGRFHYIRWPEVLPQPVTNLLDALAENPQQQSLSGKQMRQLRQMAARYPQIRVALRKMLWEEGEVKQAVAFAKLFDAPETYQVLEEFALGQEGDDQERIEALLALQAAGYFGQDRPQVRFWKEGAWTTLEMYTTPIQEREPSEAYPPEARALLQRATRAQIEKHMERAKTLYRRVLKIAPQAKEAYHNLAVIEIEEGNEETAEALLRQALEANPNYLLAQIHLALLAFQRGDPEPAKALNRVWGEQTAFSPPELLAWAYLQALVAEQEGRLDDAERHIEFALELDPDNAKFRTLKERISWKRMVSQANERRLDALHRRRERRRAQLGTRNPTLSQALALYTREHLEAIGQRLDVTVKWYTPRKAKRLQMITERLQTPDVLTRLVAELDEEARRALQRVLEAGGALDWETFSREFDNDWEELETWKDMEPQSVMGKLRARGLLIESEADGTTWLCVPVELREPLQRLLPSLGKP